MLKSYLNPSSVAIIGASEDTRKPGARILASIIKGNFQGKIYPINLKCDSVQGIPAYRNIHELPSVPDIAIICIPIETSLESLEELAKIGVKAVVIVSSVDPEDEVFAGQIKLILDKYPDTSLIGPSSVGVYGAEKNFSGNFMTADGEKQNRSKPQTFIVSQSGGVGAYIYSSLVYSGINASGVVCTGLEADLTFEQVVTAAVQEVKPKLILGYIEGSRNLSSLQESIYLAHAHGINVLLIRGGAHPRSSKAARKHTGSTPITQEKWSSFVDPSNCLTAQTIEEMVDFARVSLHPKKPKGSRVTIAAVSGGAGVLTTDAMESAGFEIANWDQKQQSDLATLLPEYTSTENPLDISGTVFSSFSLFNSVLQKIDAHPDSDIVVLSLGNMSHLKDRLINEISRFISTAKKYFVVIWSGGDTTVIKRFAERGTLAFGDSKQMAEAIMKYLKQQKILSAVESRKSL